MVLKILGKPSSINVRKVLWTCAELDLPYQLEPWGTPELPAGAPEFLRLNPNGLVPVLVDHGEVLWESNTICRYLAVQYPDPQRSLLPQSAMGRAQVEKWMDWQATELNPAWRYAFMALVRSSAAHADPAAIAASTREWNRLMGLLEGALASTGAYAAGASFTLADVVLGLSVHRWLSTPIDHAQLPAVQAYYQRLCERPAFLAQGRNGHP